MGDTFSSRLERATAKEEADAEQLRQKHGCKVYGFGQALLPDDARRYLKNHPSVLYIRWLSDRFVVRPDLCNAGASESMWLVDSKYQEEEKWPRYDKWVLEKDAHAAHRLQQAALGLPHVYIWPDGCSCSYVDDLTDEVLEHGPPNSSGSGTPYWLVPKKLTRSLEEVFGKTVEQSVDDDFSDWIEQVEAKA